MFALLWHCQIQRSGEMTFPASFPQQMSVLGAGRGQADPGWVKIKKCLFQAFPCSLSIWFSLWIWRNTLMFNLPVQSNVKVHIFFAFICSSQILFLYSKLVISVCWECLHWVREPSPVVTWLQHLNNCSTVVKFPFSLNSLPWKDKILQFWGKRLAHWLAHIYCVFSLTNLPIQWIENN